MAIRRDVKYPGRWTPADTAFPMGGPKNRTTDTAKDGSYFDREWIADYEAFYQRLMSESGISANGISDTAPTSQFYDALIIESTKATVAWWNTIPKGTAFNKNFGSEEGTVCQGNDPRLSNAREWTAEVVSKAEAEAGESVTPRKWTAHRVHQAFTGRRATFAQAQEATSNDVYMTPASVGQSVIAGGSREPIDVTSNRVFNVIYTNTYQVPMFVSIIMIGSTAGNLNSHQIRKNESSAWLSVGGKSEVATTNVSYIVPKGWQYRCLNSDIHNWLELR